jgi:cell division protein DivIC
MRKRFNLKTIGVIIAFLYAGGIFTGQRVNAYKLRLEIQKQQSELQKVKERNQRLQDEVKMSRMDMYIEKLARERLGLIKEKETPVIHSTDKK